MSDNRGLGGTTPGDTIVNGGILDSWGPHGAVAERITFNRGTIQQGNPNNQQFTLTGYLTLNNNVTFNTSSPTSGVEIAGYVDGPGGFTQANAGWLYITGDTNTYSGPTIINSGRTISVGRPNLYSGVLGVGTVTNGSGGTLNGYSRRISDRSNVNFPYAQTNVTSVLNIYDGNSLLARNIIMGEGGSVSTGRLAGTVIQYGGTVKTFDYTAESNGIRVAHWPQADCVYNMMGGTFTVDNGWDLCIATDGTGWLHQVAGEIYASRVMLHERMNNTSGFGRLTVEGGVLNIGLTNGIPNVVGNGISADGSATCLVEYGGLGGVVRASTNFSSSLNATLYGTGTNAISFDTKEWTVYLSGRLTGAGGLNKRGSGDLVLSGTNTYEGPTRIMEGAVVPSATYALSTNSVVVFGVAADGSGGTLRLPAGFSLAGLTVGVANPEDLDEQAEYVVATWSDSLGGMFGSSALPGPWYVYYDWENRTAKLRAAIGTVLKVR